MPAPTFSPGSVHTSIQRPMILSLMLPCHNQVVQQNDKPCHALSQNRFGSATDLFYCKQNLLLDPATWKQCWSNDCFCQGSDAHVTEASFLKGEGYPPRAGGLVLDPHTKCHSITCHTKTTGGITTQTSNRRRIDVMARKYTDCTS